MKKRKSDGELWIELEDGDLPSSAYTHRFPIGKRAQGYGSKVEIELDKVAVEILGEPGFLLAASKSGYRDQHPDHDVYFNACVFDGRDLRPRRRHHATQIWFGDLDLTLQAENLQELANRVGPIVVTSETPYRFKGLPKKPRDLETLSGIRIYRPRVRRQR